MKLRFFKILKTIFIWTTIIVSIIVIIFYSYNGIEARGDAVITDFNIVVSKGDNGSLLSVDDINKNITIEYPDLIGKPLALLNLNEMEQFIAEMDGVRDSRVYFSYDSLYSNPVATIFIAIEQKEPLLRVITDKDIFVMKDGSFIKRRAGYSADVLVARGHISDQFITDNLIVLVEYINDNKPWDELIGEIIVDSDRDIVLRSKIDGPRVVIGDVKNLDTKFRNLDAFYHNVMPTKDAGEVREISVKYSSQVLIK